MVFEIIEPVFHRTSPDASFKFTAGSFHADYYCIYFRLRTTTEEAFSGSLVLAEKSEGESRYAKFENGTYKFDLGRDLIEFLYHNMKAEIDHRKTNTIRWGWGSAESSQKMVGTSSAYQARLAQNDKCLVIGLFPALEVWNNNFETMDYAMMACADATVQIYEKGIAVGPLNSRYQPNDTFTISVEKAGPINEVRFYLNSACLYQSSTPPRFPLRAAICAREDGARISESKIFGDWIA